MENKETREIRELLNSDEHLFNSTLHEIQAGRYSLNTLSCAAQLIAQIRASLQMSPNTRLSTIWIRAASSDLLGSPLLRETMLSMKKISSDKLTRLLPDLERFNRSPFNIAVDIAKYQKELKQLVAANTDSKPLRSHHDVGNENVRTTVVAQKVLLSRHKATLSEKDKVYSDLVTRFHEELEGFLESALIDPKELFPSEILMYDFTSPHTEVFQPRPRFAIERALAGPHDYLGCDCCGAGGDHGGEGEWATTQPATAILYQLYLESGALINVSDLWSAFNAMVGEEDEESQSRTMYVSHIPCLIV